jgi:hypothetical protein
MKNPALAGFVFTAVIFGLHNAIQPYQALGQYSLSWIQKQYKLSNWD